MSIKSLELTYATMFDIGENDGYSSDRLARDKDCLCAVMDEVIRDGDTLDLRGVSHHEYILIRTNGMWSYEGNSSMPMTTTDVLTCYNYLLTINDEVVYTGMNFNEVKKVLSSSLVNNIEEYNEKIRGFLPGDTMNTMIGNKRCIISSTEQLFE